MGQGQDEVVGLPKAIRGKTSRRPKELVLPLQLHDELKRLFATNTVEAAVARYPRHIMALSSEPKDRRMSLVRIAVIAGAGMFLGLAPASAAPINPAGLQTIRPRASVEQIYYRRYNNAAIPEAIVGGIISGVIGNAIGGSCYYNDCGYGDGYYGGGGYVGGGRAYRGGRGGGGRVNVGHAGGHGRH
jgi:hypothetical protein